MDPVSQILQTYRVNAQIFHNAKYCGAFNVDTSKAKKIPFHIVTTGKCFLTVPGTNDKAVKMQAGDIVILPRAQQHHLCDSVDTHVEVNAAQSLPFSSATGESGTGLVCGYMEFDHIASNPFIDTLPDSLVIHSSESPWCDHLLPIINVLISESLNDGSGVQVTLNRLVDVIFVLIVREFIRGVEYQTGIIAALADPKIAKALTLMHGELSKDWTVETLAEKAAMSRSDFAKKFKTLLGESPKSYLVRLRIQNAYRRLKDTDEAMIAIALSCGYASEAAFSKAFKKVLNISPGKIRKLAE